jgi:tetratricopeptide (TPR) repeat protein
VKEEIMIWKSVGLTLSQTERDNLKVLYKDVIAHVEKEQSLCTDVLEGLKKELSAAVEASEELTGVLQEVRDSGEHYAVQLLDSDNEILNLPWSMAVDPVSGQALAGVKRFYLCKSQPELLQQDSGISHPDTGPPLKILIMLSSPEDLKWKRRLSHEEEEFEILKAFEPLMHSAEVEVDFTDDGSLEALERKLAKNKYHVLHFSGHGRYEKGKGELQLENPLNLRTSLAPASDFAEALRTSPDYTIPLVVLSSCQTAQGGTEQGLRGVTNHLLRAGVPAVISMGMSIYDRYAALFSAHFYKQIAEGRNIALAFHSALNFIKEKEYEEQVRAHLPYSLALQWIIPQLYLTTPVEYLVDWDKGQEKLEFRSHRYIFEKGRLLLKHDNQYLFIGRRMDKAQILEPFFTKTPVLLKGQGGVGKTAMAEYLIQRLIAHNSRTVPLTFNENVKTVDDIIDLLKGFLLDEGDISFLTVLPALDRLDKAMDKIRFLISFIAKTWQPVFVFDNLEAFQKDKGGEFAPEYQDLAEVIAFLCTIRKYHFILTCRYPVPGFDNIHSFDLDHVSLNDFWKKSLYMDINRINEYLNDQEKERQRLKRIWEKPEVEFIDIITLLHQTFGGNYRALEFFNELFRKDPDKIINSLSALESFKESYADETAQALAKMGKNLLFKDLMSLLDQESQTLLALIYNFRIPVQELALKLQGHNNCFGSSLTELFQTLNNLTLIEISLDRETYKTYYYATPLVKNLLEDYAPDSTTFSHHRAGIYHYHMFENLDLSLTEAEEAFYHFHEAKTEDKLQTLGKILSDAYYSYSMFKNACFYAMQVYEMLGDETNEWILNRLGLIFDLYGQYDQALSLYEKAHLKYKEIGDKSGEGTTLNNMAAAAYARGDYETALLYLKQSLNIQKEIGDKSGEAYTLFNMAMAYRNEKINQPEKGNECLKKVIELNSFLRDGRLTEALKNWGVI